MAQSGSNILDQNFTGPRPVEFEFEDLEGLVGFEQNCSFGLHECSPLPVDGLDCLKIADGVGPEFAADAAVLDATER
jgi:hypothetical protein